MVRIMLADSHTYLRKQLAERLSREPLFEIVDQVSTAAGLLERVHAAKPDVLIIDPYGKDNDFVEALKNLRYQLPDLRIVVLASVLDTYQELMLRRLGAHVILNKGLLTEELIEKVLNQANPT